MWGRPPISRSEKSGFGIKWVMSNSVIEGLAHNFTIPVSTSIKHAIISSESSSNERGLQASAPTAVDHDYVLSKALVCTTVGIGRSNR